MRTLLWLSVLLFLQACKHPLAIEGQGNIIELLLGVRGCTLSEFQTSSPKCTDNQVIGESYEVSYQAVPRPQY